VPHDDVQPIELLLLQRRPLLECSRSGVKPRKNFCRCGRASCAITGAETETEAEAEKETAAAAAAEQAVLLLKLKLQSLQLEKKTAAAEGSLMTLHW